MLLSNGRASVGLNGSLDKEFKIARGMKQGCLMPLYRFLIVVDIFNHIFKKALGKGRILGVRLPGGKQQCISQYAKDSSFLIQGEKTCIDEIVRLLKVFCMACGLIINWHKSCAYWFDQAPKPVA